MASRIAAVHGAADDVLEALEAAFAPVLGAQVFAAPPPAPPPEPTTRPDTSDDAADAVSAKGKGKASKVPPKKSPAPKKVASKKQAQVPDAPEIEVDVPQEPPPPSPPDEYDLRIEALRAKVRADVLCSTHCHPGSMTSLVARHTQHVPDHALQYCCSQVVSGASLGQLPSLRPHAVSSTSGGVSDGGAEHAARHNCR